MKKCIVFIFGVLFLSGCDSENAHDCIKTDGEIINYTVALPEFNKIRTEDDISVELTSGETQKVTVETGENLVSDLNIFVENEELILQNTNSCNLIRDHNVTLIRITSQNITRIRHGSSATFKSVGTLPYPNLSLQSITGGFSGANKNGDFDLKVNCKNLTVYANGSSGFLISGYATTGRFIFSDEFPQLQGGQLLVDDLIISHTGAAPMVVNPKNSIKGQIKGTGNVISKNRPPVVEVEELYTGRLIFED